jgi:hypothetical protein
MLKHALIALFMGSIVILAAACGLSVEERLKLFANNKEIPYVYYDVNPATKERLETITVKLTYDPATKTLNGPYYDFVVPPMSGQDIVSALESADTPDSIHLYFNENKMWNQDVHGFYITRAEEPRITDNKGKKEISLRLVPLQHVPMDELDARNDMIYRAGNLNQVALDYVNNGLLGKDKILSPLWIIRNPSRKRAHLVLIDEPASMEKFLVAIGAKEPEKKP